MVENKRENCDSEFHNAPKANTKKSKGFTSVRIKFQKDHKDKQELRNSQTWQDSEIEI